MSGFLFSACSKEPSFPITPDILEVKILPTSSTSADIVISFTDGDGDLGWETNASAGTQKDIVMYYQKMEAGIWVDQTDFVYEYVITPVLTPAGQDKFLEGELSVDIAYPPAPPVPAEGDSIRFGVTLKDRAGHISQLVFSNEIVF